MLQRIICFFIVVSFSLHSYGQTDSLGASPTDSLNAVNNGLRISLLTCGVGDEIWEQFGHTAVRVTDSTANTDMVYNYGTFSFGEGFEIQFMRGKLLYYVSHYPYSSFLQEYQYLNRSVSEQELILKPEDEIAIRNYLAENAKEENRYYKYDFFFDNCATRIRDIFPKALGPSFHFGQTLPPDSKLTFRDIMNKYFYRVHFERLGCNLLLGSPIDKVMSNEDIMFLPDFLRDGIAGAEVNRRNIAKNSDLILAGPGYKPAGPNWPLIIMTIIAVLTLTGVVIPKLKLLGNVMSFVLLFITGLLGILMLVMWFWTDHQACNNNFNILWALPTNIVIAFMNKRNKEKYALIAIILIFVSLLLHIFRVQVLPIVELTPLLVALLFIFGSMLKQSKRRLYDTA